MFEKKLMLDTCALIWLVSGADEISDNAKKQIENASLVYVSPISAWEISLKEQRGALKLPVQCEEWFCSAIENHNLTVYPLDYEILVFANRLPWHHKDPADRFIIASAIKEKAAIITADKRFRKYDIKVII